jgi:hypothetical protein
MKIHQHVSEAEIFAYSMDPQETPKVREKLNACADCRDRFEKVMKDYANKVADGYRKEPGHTLHLNSKT